MRSLYVKWLALVQLVTVVTSLPVWASKPSTEKSLEACEALLNGAARLRVSQSPSASTLIPLSDLIASRKSSYIAALWRWSFVYSKSFPSPGLVQMFRTAETAADALVDQMGINAVTPSYNYRSPFDAADATLQLIESENPPEYIRKAVLIRDNVLVVVPILKRVVKKSSKTGLPVYMPIVTKGHQSLQDADVLQAAFAAWALEPWQGQLSEEAEVYLQPIVAKRAKKQSANAKDNLFKIRVEDYIPQVQDILENFMAVAEEASKIDDEGIEGSRPERRLPDSKLGRWAALFRAKLAAAQDITMMPQPAKEGEVALLEAMGVTDLPKLASVDINSEMFVDLCFRTGITPNRMRYFVAHAKAAVENRPLVIEGFEDPYVGVETLVHIDFEDLLSRRLRSGVYLFGIEVQDPRRMSSPDKGVSEKKFIWTQELSLASVDKAWAEFFRFFQNHPKLKGEYKITMYSKHELVKLEQQFDILKQPAKDFSPKERDSKYYSETKQGNTVVGRLIRRRDFFKAYPDITPADIWNLMDRAIDLLDPIRKNFAFPTYTNSIKQVLKYTKAPDDTVEYAPGLNGLESTAWAKEAYATQEPELKQRIQRYNEMDIDSNRIVSDFLKNHAGKFTEPSLSWDARLQTRLPEIETAIQTKRKVSQLKEKGELLAKIMDKPLEKLSKKQIWRLKRILDRTEYLKKRQELSENDEYSEEEIEALQQAEKFEVTNERQSNLYEFFEAVNPEIKDDVLNAPIEAMAELFSQPGNSLTPKHIDQILLLARMKAPMDGVFRTHPELTSRSPWIKASVPNAVLAKFEALELESPFSKPETQRLWEGLYYDTVFFLHAHKETQR